MKILIDESVPWPIHQALAGHHCSHTREMGWTGYKNGDLLHAAENNFALFITTDANFRFQQIHAGSGIAVIELSTNKLRRIQKASAQLLAAVNHITPGEFTHVNIP